MSDSHTSYRKLQLEASLPQNMSNWFAKIFSDVYFRQRKKNCTTSNSKSFLEAVTPIQKSKLLHRKINVEIPSRGCCFLLKKISLWKFKLKYNFTLMKKLENLISKKLPLYYLGEKKLLNKALISIFRWIEANVFLVSEELFKRKHWRIQQLPKNITARIILFYEHVIECFPINCWLNFVIYFQKNTLIQE